MTIPKILPVLLAASLWMPLAGLAAPFQDVLDTPAQASALAAKSPINALARAGDRIVAVGQRGHILFSDDAGKTWQQAAVPVSSDLVAVHFPSAQKGWAVGHDGVILHSQDAGKTWVKQLDGRMAGQRMPAYYAQLAASGALGPADESAKLLDEVNRIAGQGAENPFLDVWFADEKTGFAVGAFNLIFRTQDGGQSWEPWFHRTVNPNRLHLYAVRQMAAGWFIVGEQGLVLKLDAAGKRFEALDTAYRGTFFGVLGSGPAVVVFGLRGNAFRSTDAGAHWTKVETGLQDGVTAGAVCRDGSLVLASQSGRILKGDSGAEHFSTLKLAQPVPASAVLCGDGDEVLVGGVRGIRAQKPN
ncbi:WD40/YVTN/BNR-like repeat-containing protein [Alicycliphilus denitrificans]|uniref:Glycosyl hydrolase n=1 Tax=Alicycliphilus denitrificans (strain DSM 14773 / CIP 107495 / K601) TaxID=596154 RepID=F4GFV9_ALIDK|nr:YCF48-related protein [Alicycliphilus denitrificans]AEB86195.1 glycosyl hydrolase [Alicycliphilus denitrificans K601]